MSKTNRNETAWKQAAESCLTTALKRAEEHAREATDFKSLESLIKTVSEIVGFGNTVNRSGGGVSGGDDDD